jgi:hypothetical protein
MTTTPSSLQPIETVEIQNAIDIAAPIEIAFEAMLDELGPDAQMEDGTAMPFKLEAWPGGRWYRDLGRNSGHLWGHVQVIKPPTFARNLRTVDDVLSRNEPSSISLCRLAGRNEIEFVHRGMGLITFQHREGMPKGWANWIDKIRQRAERKAK